MPPPDSMTALAQRIVPVMQDFGLSAFVIVGYAEAADGTLRRVCIANAMKNPAFEDGLRPVINFAHMWGAMPPPAQTPDSPPTESSGLAPE